MVNKRAFRLIFLLLTLTVLMVFGLQAYWLHNFYRQRAELLSSSIYAALEQAGTKIKAGETLGKLSRQVKVSVGLPPELTIAAEVKRITGLADSVVAQLPEPSERALRLSEAGSDSLMVQTDQLERTVMVNQSSGTSTAKIIITSRPGRDFQITKLDSVRNDLQKRRKNLDVHLKRANSKREYGKLVGKMLNDIRVIFGDSLNPDSVHSLLSSALHNKGLHLPFDFSIIRRSTGETDTICASNGFDPGKVFFESDLSVNSVLRNDKYLLLQYPGLHNQVMASMQSTIILSLLFSMMVLSLFAYTMRLILRQKKLGDIKNDFVNNMTHELKTPIATIGLAIDALSKPQVRENAARFDEYSRILKEENRKLNSHVERVLQVSLLEKDLMKLQLRELDLVKLVSDVIQAFRLRAEEQGSLISFETVLWEAPLLGDAQHLESVITNLLDNALKYGGTGVSIKVRLKRVQQVLVLEVEDDGPGIPVKFRERIFEKFYRLNGGDLHDIKGFGLGLSYVKSMIEAHGGSIVLSSGAPGACIFTINLRVYEKDSAG